MEINVGTMGQSNLLWCCDIVSRLNNDIQSLSQDLQILFKLQLCYRGLQRQFDQIFLQLDKKLELLSTNKIPISAENEKINYVHIEEFVTFMKKAWSGVSETLANENGKARFISFVRGVPLKPIVDELNNFCFHCSRILLPKFHHMACHQMFLSLSNQLSSTIFPEVEHVDSFEQSLRYLTSSLPCLINLLTFVDMYTYSSRYDRIESLCNDFFPSPQDNETSTLVPSSLLETPSSCDYCLDYIPQEPDWGYVAYWVPKMVSYIVKVSVVPRRFSTISSKPRGILDSSYISCTKENFHDSSAGNDVLPNQEKKNRRGRPCGRGRGHSKDLNPIRVPKLTIQPFAY